MVKAKIGKIEIDGTPEEVAYILNGIYPNQEKAGVVSEPLPPHVPKYTVPPLSRAKVPFGVNKLGTVGKKYSTQRSKKIHFKAILGCTLMDWLNKNYPNLPKFGKRKKIIRALRAAGVPYHISKRRLSTSIGSALYQINKNKKPGYTREEVEELNAQVE